MSSTNAANFPAANANTPAAPEATTNRNATASPNTPTRTVIVGGVAGGMSAAARLRRRDETAEIIVLESSGHVSFANCGLPYYLGGVIEDRNSLLLQTPDSLRARFNLDVRVNTTATRIDRAAKTVHVQPEQGEPYELSYDHLVLSPGASPFVPPIPGIERAYTLRNIEDTDAITAALNTTPQTAVIIGGGFIGLEVAENFAHRGITTTIIEAGPQIMAPLDPEMAQVVQEHLEANGVDVLTNEQVNNITASHVETAAGSSVPADIVISAVGVRPNDDLARAAGLDVGDRGGIVVDEQLRTSDPSIFALGDAALKKDATSGADVLVPLAQTANRHGRLVADVIAAESRGESAERLGTVPVKGTSVVQLFGLTATAVGWSEKRAAAELGSADKGASAGAGGAAPFGVVHLHPLNHAGYYPGASALRMKLIYRTDDGRILGAQVIGMEGADKRIDVIATAMQAGLTAFELADLELAYSPQVGSAKDPVNIAGYIADNRRHGQLSVQWHEVEALQEAGWIVVDVRTPGEFERGAIPGAVNIPVDELRERAGEIPAGAKVIAQCQVGLRGNVATQLLANRGVTVANLDGGYVTWSYGQAAQMENAQKENGK